MSSELFSEMAKRKVQRPVAALNNLTAVLDRRLKSELQRTS